ncbi:hypothetical protein BLNAU_1505 [Blattamonas nauphoetae]|uniref:Uncharacterized protein n=1 Tax=Blattamonas nauphoetae TaxID=2049346 RepID=A0ABQ9YI79_9EUKA|nr:hypothetical protein BLNAU_1505 [Blattamonas nauphoetae]
MTSENEGTTLGSTVILADVSHHSMSDHVAPFVGLTHPQHPLVSPRAMKRGDGVTSQADCVTIVGSGLCLESKDLIGGTGPLFSFGVTERASSLTTSGRRLHMETSLVGSNLVNMTCSSDFLLGNQLFGSEVCQRVVGIYVSSCTNHDSGTGMMSPNLGGNVMCLNTSFSSCIRHSNTEYDFSFENRTESEIGRLNNVTKDVTSVTFTLCTFNEMSAAAGNEGGGAAIFVKWTSSSLTVKTCSFHRCSCTGVGDDGGAVQFKCDKTKNFPFIVSDSSFTECSTRCGTELNCGGSFSSEYAFPVSIDGCFYELSNAYSDGAAFLGNLALLSLSNTAFVDCSADDRSGAVSIFWVTTISLAFIQFRDCSTEGPFDSNDMYLNGIESSLITSDMITLCDSTSGAPNLFFSRDLHTDSSLVPQIDSIPTITSVDVSFGGSEATVTVETDFAIKGTLGVLLDGSNVPRLAHVVFGDSGISSKVGKATISSGPKGILPSATYTHRKSALAPFPPPTVRAAESSLMEDWNTTEIVVKGDRLGEGSYWMEVEKEGAKWNITLIFSDSTTLTGTAPLHPSTAAGRLEWSTEYEVTKVMWLPDGEHAEKEVKLSNKITFSTPDQIIRIISADCSLGGDQLKSALVTLTGVKLREDKDFSITIRKMEGLSPSGGEIVLSGTLSGASLSTTHTHSELIFGIVNPLLSFRTTYLITNFDVHGVLSAVDADVTFSVPAEPARIVGVETRYLTKDRATMIVLLKGRALLFRTGKVSLMNGSASWDSLSDVIVLNNTHCTAEFTVREEDTGTDMKFGEEYTLKGSWTESSGFLVEDGITIVVHFPPRITIMEFVFSNTLHTGCFVTLTGTDLIVGESLKITLNDSLSFIVTVTSETKAESSELPIGWSITIQHSTTYEITSIEAMNEDDGRTIFDSPVTDTTGSLAGPFVIYVDFGSSSDSSLFCGDFDRPCSSIEDGWKIAEGVGIISLSISIIHISTQKEQMNILDNRQVVIESGSSTKPELFVSPSSSSLEGAGMIEVSGGSLWIRQVDIHQSDSPSLIFIRMDGGRLTIETCTLTGQPSSHPPNELEASTDLCVWESGILTLLNCETTIKQTELIHLSQGAIHMKGGSLTIRSSSFDSNSPHSSSFPSLHRNILCSEGGEIEVGSLSGGDGMETSSAWISASDCSLTAKDSISRSPFFVPTLSSSSTSAVNKTEKTFILMIEGTILIPCSLFLEVFEKKNDGNDGKMTQFPLTQDTTTSFNESTIELSLPLSSLSSLDDSLEWRGRLAFGKDEISVTSFLIQENAVERKSQTIKENMKWWLPLVISLLVVLVIVLVVVFVCWRRRRILKNGPKETEMNESDPLPMEDEKMDIVTDNKIGVNSIHTFSSSESNEATKQKEELEPSDDLIGFENMEEVFVCSGDLKKTAFVSKDRTLYNTLHSEKKWDVRVRQAQLQLVRGLKGVSKKDRDAAILRALTAHNILFDSNQNVCLKLNLDVTPPTPLHNDTRPQPQPDLQVDQPEQPEQQPTAETNELKPTSLPFSQPANEGVRWPDLVGNGDWLCAFRGARCSERIATDCDGSDTEAGIC